MVELVLTDEMSLSCIAMSRALISLPRFLCMTLALSTFFSGFRQYVPIIVNF
jgi:hypothetical protein